MDLAVFWFAFAVACGIISKKKNRNSAGWFFLGLLGGIFSLGILLLLPMKDNYGGNYDNTGYGNPPPNNNFARATYKKCPFCAEQIMSEAIVCKHCGRDLNQRHSIY